jgi:hypothetical protein
MDDDIFGKLSISFNPNEVAQQLDELKASEREKTEKNSILKREVDELTKQNSDLDQKLKRSLEESASLTSRLVEHEAIKAEQLRTLQADKGKARVRPEL